MEMEIRYEPPLDALLTLGEASLGGTWMDYATCDLRQEHIAELLEMATDDRLHQADANGPEVWAPLHAWRALGQLRAAAAATPLLELLDDLVGDDWSHEEIPVVLGLIGAAAIAPARDFLAQPHHDLSAHIGAANGLSEIGEKDPTCREECVQALTASLRNFSQHDPALNAFLISGLVELEAVEAAGVIEQAFAADQVDWGIRGDWEDVQVDLGLLGERLTPLANELTRRDWDGIAPARQQLLSVETRKKSSEKEKRKRKAAQKSRKKNRKRKR